MLSLCPFLVTSFPLSAALGFKNDVSCPPWGIENEVLCSLEDLQTNLVSGLNI